jgi:HAMP domain-containing protein
MATKYNRTRLWVDPPFQFRLLLRMGFYLFLYTACIWHIAFLFEALAAFGADGTFKGLGTLYLEFLARQRPMLFALLLIAPIFLYDLLKFSHRVAGPLFRCRRVMQEMAEGKPVAEFTPRKRDLLGEFFQTFNALIRTWNARVETSTEAPAEPPGPAPGKNGSARPERLQV